MTFLFKKASQLFSQTKSQILILVLITLLSYGNIFQNSFAWDDFDFFYDWFTIKDTTSYSSFLALPELLSGDLPEGHRGVFRPVRSVYYLISYKLYGTKPFFYHFQAIIVHSLIVIFIYLISGLITKKKLASFICAAAFAAHPIHTEAITFTTASMDTIGILFFFASFYFYIKARLGNSEKKLTYTLSILLGSLAFLTYEMTLTLPLLILAYEFIFHGFNIKKILKNTPLLIFFLILCLYAFLRICILHIGNRADYLGQWYVVASNQAKISTPEYYLIYIKLLLMPVNLTIAHDLPQFFIEKFSTLILSSQEPDKWLGLAGKYVIFFPIFVNSLCILISYLLFRRFKIVIFSLVWFFIPLLAVSNIVPQGTTVAERFLYISSFGFCLLLGFIADWLFKSKRFSSSIFLKSSLTIVLSTLLLFYIYQTINRNFDWKNGETIMESALRVNPNSFIAKGALGVVKLRFGKYDEAIEYLKSALHEDSDYSSTRIYLGVAYRKKGDLGKAIESFNQAIQNNPKDPLAYSYLGSTYLETSTPEKAIEPYKKSVHLNPEEAYTHFNLAQAYLKIKNYAEAANSFNKAHKLNQYFTEARINMEYKRSLEEQNQELIKFYLNYLESINIEAI